MKRILYQTAFGVYFLFSGLVGAQGQVPPGSGYSVPAELSGLDQLALDVTRAKETATLKNARWGMVIYDPVERRILFDHNGDQVFVPASTTKLLTTESIMHHLGAGYSFVTQLEYSGDVDEAGVLHGNLYLVGSADPSLGTNKAGASTYYSIAQDFIQSLQAVGIRSVEGALIVQNGVFESSLSHLPSGIVFRKQNNYFLPVGGTQGLSAHLEKAVVKHHPLKKDYAYMYMSPHTGKLVYTEDAPENLSPLVTPARGPLYLANYLKNTFKKSGISIYGSVQERNLDTSPESRIVVGQYISPRLSEMVYFTNQRSDNGLAESLLRTLGFYQEGEYGLEGGKRAVNRHLAEKKYDFQGLQFADGSGLSKLNYVSPISQAKFLAGVMKEPYYKEFFASLPIAGQTGTLKRMFLTSKNFGQINAKTGTLNTVKTLAGYAKTRGGKTLTFSVLLNGYRGSVAGAKKVIEDVLESVSDL